MLVRDVEVDCVQTEMALEMGQTKPIRDQAVVYDCPLQVGFAESGCAEVVDGLNWELESTE